MKKFSINDKFYKFVKALRIGFSQNNWSRLLLYFYQFKIRKVFNLGLCFEQAYNNQVSSIVPPPGAKGKALVSG